MAESKTLSREERLALWREERRKAKAKGAGKAAGGAKKPAPGVARRRRKESVSKEKRLSSGGASTTVGREHGTTGSRFRQSVTTVAVAKKPGILSNVMGGPAMRLAVGSHQGASGKKTKAG